MNRPVTPSLPRLVLIGEAFTTPAQADRLLAAVGAGINWVHLRAHEASTDRFRRAARGLVPWLRAASPSVLVSINSRLPVARELRTGFHTGAEGPSLRVARLRLGAAPPLGYSAHAAAEASTAVRAGATYVFLSPIFPTSSKPGHPGVGLQALADVVAHVAPAPVYALGGITPARIATCLEAGAYGVAVLSGILHANDAAAAARRYLQALADASPMAS
ncbi:MAG: thiamine phosphate synthase [Bacteroidetes bacterium]|jgi:thiamine-phosphate pyrophosphorylase|nr:thiamine phosphate synthase [Bacteroidota bacterium]